MVQIIIFFYYFLRVYSVDYMIPLTKLIKIIANIYYILFNFIFYIALPPIAPTMKLKAYIPTPKYLLFLTFFKQKY